MGSLRPAQTNDRIHQVYSPTLDLGIKAIPKFTNMYTRPETQ